MKNTVEWYRDNLDWVDSVRSGTYREWIEKHCERGMPIREQWLNLPGEIAFLS